MLERQAINVSGLTHFVSPPQVTARSSTSLICNFPSKLVELGLKLQFYCKWLDICHRIGGRWRKASWR